VGDSALLVRSIIPTESGCFYFQAKRVKKENEVLLFASEAPETNLFIDELLYPLRDYVFKIEKLMSHVRYFEMVECSCITVIYQIILFPEDKKCFLFDPL